MSAQKSVSVPNKRKHVTLLVETSTSYGVDIVRGVADYANANACWTLYSEPRGKYELLQLPGVWSGDGIIARVNHELLAKQIVAANVPCVNVSWYDYETQRIPRCTCDERLAGELVAKHLLDRGFRNFAYCGPRRRPNYRDLFGNSFVDLIDEAGYECIRLDDESGTQGGAPTREELETLANWVFALPKQTAVLAFSDVRAKQVVDVCRQLGLRVPDDIAVIGGEHDELSSQIAEPHLSGLDLSPRNIGFEAAKLLDRLMTEAVLPNEPILLPPTRVIVRQSTDTLAVEDPIVLRALQYISENINEPINVKQLLTKVPTSRRVLEQRFREVLGRTPGEEIRRVRVERAKTLLAETDYTLKRIANECGFHHTEVLSRVFKRDTGETPSSFRSRAKS